jgi:hypothetical protein
MITTSRDVPTPVDNVFAVLADGWTYAAWVVGNSHIRDVDANWPEVGTRIHHSVGIWPVQIHDYSEVVAMEHGRFLELDARLWLIGAARIRLTLTALTATSTRIEMSEEIVRGIGSVVPSPLQATMIRPRNDEALARLADLAVGRASHH